MQRQRVGLMRHIFLRIVQELWHALVYAFVLLTLCLSWFIGMTRFWDNVSCGVTRFVGLVCCSIDVRTGNVCVRLTTCSCLQCTTSTACAAAAHL